MKTIGRACDISAQELEARRERLSRHYDIMAEVRLEALGYGALAKRVSLCYRLWRNLEEQFLPHYFHGPPRWRKYIRRFSSKRTLPDFCVVGPSKCGTSDLAVNLILHPNIIPPLSKEFPSPDPDDWRIFYPSERQKKRHEHRYGLALSPYLHPSLHRMEVAYGLAAEKPGIKIVIVLRDPAERLYSHWKWEVFLAGRKRASRLPFLATFGAYVDKALDVYGKCQMFTACDAPGLEESIYWKSVENWVACFGRENVLVLDVDDYFMDRSDFLHKIQDFIGLPRLDVPKSISKTNENPVQVPPADEQSLSKLRNFFEPYNERLWMVLGEEFKW